ncbi:hypothetical protein ACE01N_12255 [Saccharicrinis sp. FJH2]|uniref:hypothetical protein n=1 Tax=Saccharicrinis sp. FJH65 TaxID=3344659 RepID=UPI0035F3C115
MKKYFVYITAFLALIATGCTDFGDETQLTLPGAPAIDITSVTPGDKGDNVTFTVKPAGTAGYYSWVLVKSELVDSTILEVPDQVLKLEVSGVANGITEYAKAAEASVSVEGLTPFTLYQVYAVASSVDGVNGVVKHVQFRTLDDGSKPTPQNVAIEDTTVTLSFHEPLNLGTGKVYVSYFAKNTVSGSNPLIVEPGYEEFNQQDMEIPAGGLSVSGNDLIIQLPGAAAGAYASVTYEEGAVLDLAGNGCSAFVGKADTLVNGVPSRGITVRVATKAWNLHNEFEESNPDSVATFAVWGDLMIPALADKGVTVAKRITSAVPLVTYNQPGKKVMVDVTTWGLSGGVPVFLLPEEPARGATVDLSVPADAFEDVYGNTNTELDIVGYYLYSYGYTVDDITGTYDVEAVSYWDGPLTESNIVIEKAADSDTILIKNLVDSGSVVKAVFDPVGGTLTLADEQVLLEGVDFGESGLQTILFVNADDSAPVIFNVPAAGTITSPSQWWGYYLLEANGWYDVYTESTWTRTVTKSASLSVEKKLKSVKSNVKPYNGRTFNK